MVASAAGMAVRAAGSGGKSDAQLQPQARAACTDYAARYGSVQVIDVQQASRSKIIVWGTVDDGTTRRSFECGFKTAIVSFRMREIVPAF